MLPDSSDDTNVSVDRWTRLRKSIGRSPLFTRQKAMSRRWRLSKKLKNQEQAFGSVIILASLKSDKGRQSA
jgi:hypothetical protein